MQRNRFSSLHNKSFMEVIPPKRVVNVALPPTFTVISYQSIYLEMATASYHQFQIDVINNRKDRRYYGRHNQFTGDTVIYDIFHNKRYEYPRHQYYIEFGDIHKFWLPRYFAMLVEFYIQP